MKFGNLYKKLAFREIPIGIYRTEKQSYRKQSISLDIEGLITTKIEQTWYRFNWLQE